MRITTKPKFISYCFATLNTRTHRSQQQQFPLSEARHASVAGVVTRGHEQAATADHYNSVVRTRDSQSDSYIYHVKRFNNWVKTCLIHGAEPDPAATGKTGQFEFV